MNILRFPKIKPIVLFSQVCSLEISLHAKSNVDVFVCSGGYKWPEGTLEMMGFDKISGEITTSEAWLKMQNIYHKNMHAEETLRLPKTTGCDNFLAIFMK